MLNCLKLYLFFDRIFNQQVKHSLKQKIIELNYRLLNDSDMI